MQNLRIQPLSEMFQPFRLSLVKEAGFQKESQRYMEIVRENPEAYPLLSQVLNGTLNVRQIPPEQKQAFNLERNKANNESKRRNFNPDAAFGGRSTPETAEAPTEAPPTASSDNSWGGVSTIGDPLDQGTQTAPDESAAVEQDAGADAGGGGDMMAQMQQLVTQRDQINQEIQKIQQMFGFGDAAGGGGTPGGGFGAGMWNGMGGGGGGNAWSPQQSAPNTGVIDNVRNWWNERELGKEQNRNYRQNLQEQKQNLRTRRMPPPGKKDPSVPIAAKSERPFLTAAMGSASNLLRLRAG